MKYVLSLILVGISCSNKAAQEWMPAYQEGAAYFKSPALRYRALGFYCSPQDLELNHEKQTDKNIEWLREKTAFFLRHKALSPERRQDLWEKLQNDSVFKQKYIGFQQWLAQKAQEPNSTKREGAVPKAGWRSTQ